MLALILKVESTANRTLQVRSPHISRASWRKAITSRTSAAAASLSVTQVDRVTVLEWSRQVGGDESPSPIRGKRPAPMFSSVKPKSYRVAQHDDL